MIKSISHIRHARDARVRQIGQGLSPIPEEYLAPIQQLKRDLSRQLDRIQTVTHCMTQEDFLRNTINIHMELSLHTVEIADPKRVRDEIHNAAADALGIYLSHRKSRS